jgi:hypothetical protein
MGFAAHLPQIKEGVRETKRAAIAPFNLFALGGNQWAIITGSVTPCQEEITGRTVDWRTCELLRTRVYMGEGFHSLHKTFRSVLHRGYARLYFGKPGSTIFCTERVVSCKHW